MKKFGFRQHTTDSTGADLCQALSNLNHSASVSWRAALIPLFSVTSTPAQPHSALPSNKILAQCDNFNQDAVKFVLPLHQRGNFPTKGGEGDGHPIPGFQARSCKRMYEALTHFPLSPVKRLRLEVLLLYAAIALLSDALRIDAEPKGCSDTSCEKLLLMIKNPNASTAFYHELIHLITNLTK